MAIETAATLLERERELTELGNALTEAQQGRGRVILFEARAGLGKTSLLRAATETATEAGFTCLGARASELERDFAFGCVRQLLEPGVTKVSGTERHRLFEGAAAFSQPLFAPTGVPQPSPSVDSSFSMQNFSEDYMLDHVLSGEIRLPAGEVPTPFLDIDDLADVAAQALTDDRHVGRPYELTGARSLTFADAAAVIGEAAGREIRYTPVSLEQHAVELAEHGVAPEFVEFLTYLFKEVVDGRNADTTDGVLRALGREPREFADYARITAASGVWNASPVSA